MKDTRNILLIGKTGSGKSTLANVLINEDGQFEEVFKEGKYGVSQTKKVHAEEFDTNGEEIKKLRSRIESLEKENRQQEIEQLKKQLEEEEEKNIKYKIIDTVGISDTKEGTKMSLNKVLYNLAKIGHKVKDGLSQIFLVTDGKSEEQTNLLYDLLKKAVFDENIAQYTTIIRTRFPSFEEEKECAKDREVLKGSEKFGEKISIVHVDNPSLNVRGTKAEERRELNVLAREASREKILNRLATCEGIYKPANLDKLNEIIDEKFKDKEMLKIEIAKEFIWHIRERVGEEKLELGEAMKEELKEMEIKLVRLDNNLEKIEYELVWELRNLEPYLGVNENFSKLRKVINQLERQIKELESEERRKKLKELVEEIYTVRESVFETFKMRFEEKGSRLQEVKRDAEKSFSNVKEKVVESASKFLFGKKQEKNLVQENLEKICQAQVNLTKSEIELENVKKILERIENYKEQLEQQLEARVEVFPAVGQS